MGLLEFGMGAGVLAVRQKLESAFGAMEFREMFDRNSDSTVLTFDHRGQIYWVRVSREFDDDFLSGTTISLRELVRELVGSAKGKVLVARTEISGACALSRTYS